MQWFECGQCPEGPRTGIVNLLCVGKGKREKVNFQRSGRDRLWKLYRNLWGRQGGPNISAEEIAQIKACFVQGQCKPFELLRSKMYSSGDGSLEEVKGWGKECPQERGWAPSGPVGRGSGLPCYEAI